MRSPVIPPSVPVIRSLVSSIGNKQGVLAAGTRLRCSGTTSPIKHLQNNVRSQHPFSHSTRPQQQQRQCLALRPAEKNTNHRRNSSHRSRNHHQQQIPAYVYFMGGIPFVGGLYLYFRFQDLAPLTGRRRWLATNPDYEKRMGDNNYRQLLVRYKSRILPRHHLATIMVERIGQRIFLVAGKFAKQNGLDASFDTKKVTFTVVDSEEANAFVLPGNHVFVLTGMFKYAKTEDEIGCILGHEMAHNLARHQGEKVSSSVVVNIIAYLSLFIDPSGSFLTLVIPAAKLLGELPNSRLQESEADQIGMRLAAEACYDPEALSHVFRRMDTAGEKGIDKNLADTPPEFLSTHPSDDTRIKDMQKWLPEDNKIFNMYGGERCRAFRRELQSCTIHNRSSRQSKRENMASTELPCWK